MEEVGRKIGGNVWYSDGCGSNDDRGQTTRSNVRNRDKGRGRYKKMMERDREREREM